MKGQNLTTEPIVTDKENKKRKAIEVFKESSAEKAAVFDLLAENAELEASGDQGVTLETTCEENVDSVPNYEINIEEDYQTADKEFDFNTNYSEEDLIDDELNASMVGPACPIQNDTADILPQNN